MAGTGVATGTVVAETPSLDGQNFGATPAAGLSPAEVRRAFALNEILAELSKSDTPTAYFETKFGSVHVSPPDGKNDQLALRFIVGRSGETIETAGGAALTDFVVSKGRVEQFTVNDPAHLGIERREIPDAVMHEVLSKLLDPK